MKSIVKKDKKKIFEIYEMFKKDSNSIDKLKIEFNNSINLIQEKSNQNSKNLKPLFNIKYNRIKT